MTPSDNDISDSLAADLAASTEARVTAETLGDEIATLCSCLYAAEARLLDMIHRFDRDRCFVKLGFHSTAAWLNYRCGFGMNAARERIRVAHALQKLPKIRARLAEGRFSYSKVRAITRVADESTEDYLEMIATHGTAHHVEKLVTKTRRCRKAQEDADAVYEARALSVHYDDSGAVVLRGRFPAEQGALILKALEMVMERDFRNKRVEDVLAETRPAPEPMERRRADALSSLAETCLNQPENAGSTADRYQVVVHVSAVTSDASTDTPASTAHLEDGPHVTAETSRRIACDCSVIPVKEDPFGEPLAIGRKSRTIPPAIRRALKLRDGGCRFPGCTHTRFVDGHHIKHWADGGETSLENLVLLCRHHHRLVHEGGFDVTRTNDGELVFTDARERPLPASMPLPGLGVDLDAWLDTQVMENRIDHDSCRAKYCAGERMDWDLAVAAMMSDSSVFFSKH